MTSFVVACIDKEKRESYITDFCRREEIDVFDVTRFDRGQSKNIQSIGVEDIKNIQQKISLKPMRSRMKAVVLDDAELLTVEAQNALLKVLEEPPDNTILILSAGTTETLLPTVLSRCQIIQLESKAESLSEEERKELQQFTTDLAEMGTGERLKKAEELAKDKEGAVTWTAKLILFLREKMITENNFQTASAIRSLQELHTLLQTTNVNPRFAFENTLINLNS